MTHSALHPSTEPSRVALPEITPEDVRAQVRRVSESPYFRASKRCRLFLERVVDHSLSDSPDPLKERTLGAQVFGRNPAYDTAVDPIVRVTAGEVRRRLGQYYAEEAHHSELRIELPPGSYLPHYSRPHNGAPAVAVAEAPGHPDAPAAGLRWWGAIAGFTVLLAVAGAAVATSSGGLQAATAFDRFWQPLFRAEGPVLLCPGGLDMYELPYDLKQAAEAAASSPAALPPIAVLPHTVQRIGARYMAIGDAVVIARIASLFQERGRRYQIRENRLTSFADLRESPAVLIGMFSNSWNLQLGSELRFVPAIEEDGHHVGILDRHATEQAWRLIRPWPRIDVDRDYALISRVVDPATGTLVVSAGGITPFGTAAAGEFLTSPDQMERALAGVRDWSARNLQIVLETQVIDGAAGAPRVLAMHVW